MNINLYVYNRICTHEPNSKYGSFRGEARYARFLFLNQSFVLISKLIIECHRYLIESFFFFCFFNLHQQILCGFSQVFSFFFECNLWWWFFPNEIISICLQYENSVAVCNRGAAYLLLKCVSLNELIEHMQLNPMWERERERHTESVSNLVFSIYSKWSNFICELNKYNCLFVEFDYCVVFNTCHSASACACYLCRSVFACFVAAAAHKHYSLVLHERRMHSMK